MRDVYELSEEVGRLLRLRGMTLSLAESCTGGVVSHFITEVPGSSDYYRGAVVAYQNDLKERILGVANGTLRDHGAVSQATAREMAEGVRRALDADIGLSTTGIAGPGGGTPCKPLGLVFLALAAPEGVWCERYAWDGARSENKVDSARAGLELLGRYLRGHLPPVP